MSPVVVRLFGSSARGDADGLSDVDFLVVDEDIGADRSVLISNYQKIFSEKYGSARISVALYSPDRIRQLHASGSLFAWHLFLESRSIFDGVDWLDSLGEPMPYVRAPEEMDELYELARSVLRSLTDGSNNLVFEAGLLYLAIRNSGIVASRALSGKFQFGRYAPYQLNGVDGVDAWLPRARYDDLYRCRSCSIGGVDAPSLSPRVLRSDSEAACGWIWRVREAVYVCES